jgi:hypothetical protein
MSQTESLSASNLEKVESNEKLSRQSPPPDIHDPLKILVSKDKTTVVRKRCLRTVLHSYKFLLSKIVYEGEESLEEWERLLIFDHIAILSSTRDYCFKRKHQKFINQTSFIPTLIQQFHEKRNQTTCFEIFLKTMFPGYLLSPHAYFGWKENHKSENWLKVINRQLRSSPPPKRFIGVGYQDKGTCRDISKDSSPSWQEVASSRLVDEKTRPFVPDHMRTAWNYYEGKLVPLAI